MTKKERLTQWMKDKGISAKDLAAATGDVNSAIYMMMSGDRPVNSAFKWRFQEAFGHDEAIKVFGIKQERQEAETA